jgi:hypothetical protein
MQFLEQVPALESCQWCGGLCFAGGATSKGGCLLGNCAMAHASQCEGQRTRLLRLAARLHFRMMTSAIMFRHRYGRFYVDNIDDHQRIGKS